MALGIILIVASLTGLIYGIINKKKLASRHSSVLIGSAIAQPTISL